MNVAATLDRRAALAPAQIAVREPKGRGGPETRTYREITYATLAQEAAHYAAAALTAGLVPGDRVAVMVPPSIAFFALTFGLFRAGVVPVFIDPGMGLRSLKRCLAEAAPHAFIGVRRAQLARLILGWERGRLRFSITPERLRRLASTALHTCHAPAEADTAAILFTSGSTGAPKGAVYRHAHFLAQIELLRETYAIEPGEIDLCTFPLFALFAPALGMSAVIPKMNFTRPAKVDPREITGPVRRFGVQNLFGSPALLRRVAEGAPTPLPSLKRVISAGAPVPAKTLAALAPFLAPEAEIHTPYGATEALPVATIGHKEVLGETAQATAEGKGICVGRPVAGVDVRIMRICDTPAGLWNASLHAAPGTIGEILVAGPQTTERYFHRPEADAAAKLKDLATGRLWHRMGDLGYLDASGRLWFCGRKTHRVATKAGELYTIPCEGVFNRHAAVHRTALVGRGTAGAMTPVLCVEPEQRLSSGARARLAAELLTLGRASPLTASVREIRFFRALPVDTRHNAKIFRERLKAVVDRKTSRSVSWN